ncbi:MAG: glycosyl hydrolase family 18 protein [Firmicutes bacterium]|nr:glycosyl hydrolase family 18 protein [Bacillota bacterium]
MIIGAYIYSGERTFTKLREGDADRLTHVFIAFAVVRDGKASVDHWKNSNEIREFIQNKGHLKIMLSIGGWGAGGFSNACLTAEGRELLAQSLVDISNDYGFDGVDLDWEYPCSDLAGIDASPDDKVNYTLWVQLLREKLGPDKLLTMAAGGAKFCCDSLEIEKLMKEMDFINLMTYDMCPWDKVGYHTALFPSQAGSPSSDKVVDMYEKAGVPRNRLVLGCGFYGRVYRNVDGLNAPVNGAPTFLGGGYPGIKARIEKSGLQYDDVAEAPYVYDEETREFITFDNPRSLTAKMKFAKETGLGGVMFWEYTHDDEDSTMLKALSGK